VAGPVALSGVLVSGLVAALWPQPEVTAAVPAPVASSSTPSVSASSSATPRTSRNEASRSALAGSATAKGFTKKPATKEGQPTLQPSRTATTARSKSASPSASLTVIGTRYTTTGLNVRSAASAGSQLITVLAGGTKVSLTSGSVSGWTAILHNDNRRWVRSQYLSTTKPSASSSSSSSGISYAPCKSGSGVESGLTPDAIRVHRAICARWPQVTTYYGVRADSLPYHPSGRALDSMISDSTVGWQIANWVRANASRLGVSEILYSQRIWTVQRSSEGWRYMSDRGSATANHYDHVHVTVYGNSGTG
jgi:hypothetical protein